MQIVYILVQLFNLFNWLQKPKIVQSALVAYLMTFCDFQIFYHWLNLPSYYYDHSDFVTSSSWVQTRRSKMCFPLRKKYMHNASALNRSENIMRKLVRILTVAYWLTAKYGIVLNTTSKTPSSNLELVRGAKRSKVISTCGWIKVTKLFCLFLSLIKKNLSFSSGYQIGFINNL